MKDNLILTIFGGCLLFLWVAWFFVRPHMLYREQVKELERVPRTKTSDKTIDGTFVLYFAQATFYFFMFTCLVKLFSGEDLLMKMVIISMGLLGIWMLIHGVLFYRLLNSKK